jgi:hypothetical protein
MKKILSIAILTLIASTGVYASETKTVEPSIENVQKDKDYSVSSSSTVDMALDSQVSDIPQQKIIPEKTDDKPYVESHTPIAFLKGQLQLTPEQVELTKNILNKHYSQAKDEFSKILTPEQQERLEYLETQEIKQSISL